MKQSTVQLLNAINVFTMVFCLLTIPGELDALYGATARYAAWAVFIAVGLSVAVVLTRLQDREKGDP